MAKCINNLTVHVSSDWQSAMSSERVLSGTAMQALMAVASSVDEAWCAGQSVGDDVLFSSHPLHTERLMQDPFAQPGYSGVVDLRQGSWRKSPREACDQ